MPLPHHRLGAGRTDTDLPLLLAGLHAGLDVGTRATLHLEPLIGGGWGPDRAADVVVGAGELIDIGGKSR